MNMGVLVHPFKWKIFCNNHYAFSLFIFFLFFNLWYYNMHVSYQKLLGVSFWLFSMLNISMSHAFPHWLSGPLTADMTDISEKKMLFLKPFPFKRLRSERQIHSLVSEVFFAKRSTMLKIMLFFFLCLCLSLSLSLCHSLSLSYRCSIHAVKLTATLQIRNIYEWCPVIMIPPTTPIGALEVWLAYLFWRNL